MIERTENDQNRERFKKLRKKRRRKTLCNI